MYHLPADQPLAVGVRAVAADQLDKALDLLDEDGEDAHHVVHEVRKRCKKVRALMRLVRDDVPELYDDVNARLRDAARVVSDTRDAGAAVETHDVLVDAFGEDQLEPYADVRAALVERAQGPAIADVDTRLDDVRSRLQGVRGEVEGWTLPEGAATDVLRAGFARTYGRARDRHADAVDEPSSEGWHEWRKRIKYHRHQVDLLREAWEPVMLHREDLLHDLTDLTGDDNDLWELRELLLGELRAEFDVDGWPDVDAELLRGYVGLVDQHRAVLQRDALRLAARLLHAPVDEHVDLLLGWWELAVAEGAEDDPAVPDPVIPVDG